MAELTISKLPPQNLESEMAVLGSMLLDDEAIAVAIETISTDSFYQNTHQ